VSGESGIGGRLELVQRVTFAVVVLLLALAAGLYHAAPSHPTMSLAGKSPLAVAEPVGKLELGSGPNLAVQAGPFTGGRWKLNLAAVEPDAGIAPDGSKTAVRLVETAGNGPHKADTSVTGVTPGGTYTLSLFVKPAERIAVQFEMLADSAGEYGIVRFNLQERTVTFTGGDLSDAGLAALPDGWSRCWAAMPYSRPTAVFNVRPLDAHGAPSYPGRRSAGLMIWGVQFEPGERPRGYADAAHSAAGR
jgi:hypothetical protein